MKLEAGKRYMTRGGKVIGPMMLDDRNALYKFMAIMDGCRVGWTADGKYCALVSESSFDLVSEYPGVIKPSEHSSPCCSSVNYCSHCGAKIEAKAKPPTIKSRLASIIASCDDDEVAAERTLMMVVRRMLEIAYTDGAEQARETGPVEGPYIYASRIITEALGE